MEKYDIMIKIELFCEILDKKCSKTFLEKGDYNAFEIRRNDP